MDKLSNVIITFTCLGILLGLLAGYIFWHHSDCSMSPILKMQDDIQFIPVDRMEQV